MFEPLLSPLFSSLIAPAQRIFIKLNGVDEYFTFQNTKTFPDDFDLSIDAVLPTAATTVTLFGQTASADHYIKALSTGFVSINIDTSIVTSTVLATKDNKQRRYGVKLIGNDFIFTEDGATIDTVTDAVAAAKILIINALCQSNGADFFNKTPSDPRLTDLTTASNSVSWQLNRALPATTEQSTDGTNLLTYVGAPRTELFTFNQNINRWVSIVRWDSLDFSATGPYVSSFTNSEIVGEWSTASPGIGPRTTAGDILTDGDNFEITVNSLDANSDFHVRAQSINGPIIVAGGSGDTTVDYSVPTGETSSQGYFKASFSGAHSLGAVSIKRFIERA